MPSRPRPSMKEVLRSKSANAKISFHLKLPKPMVEILRVASEHERRSMSFLIQEAVDEWGKRYAEKLRARKKAVDEKFRVADEYFRPTEPTRKEV